MAAAVDSQHMVVLGPHKMEIIYIDSVDATSLADVVTHLANPKACNLFEVSHTDGTTNDSQTKAGTPLAVFSSASGSGQKKIDCSGMTAGKWYILQVFGF